MREKRIERIIKRAVCVISEIRQAQLHDVTISLRGMNARDERIEMEGEKK